MNSQDKFFSQREKNRWDRQVIRQLCVYLKCNAIISPYKSHHYEGLAEYSIALTIAVRNFLP